MPPLSAPTFPPGVTAAALQFSALVDTFTIDDVFFGMGEYTTSDLGTKFATKSALTTELGSLTQIGELAESPGKVDSKIERLKTRNFQIPGKRTSTFELTLNGLSNIQKSFFEGPLFSGKLITIVGVSKDRTRATVFNGMRWTVDWSGESDGLWTVVISTEFTGATVGKIYLVAGLS